METYCISKPRYLTVVPLTLIRWISFVVPVMVGDTLSYPCGVGVEFCATIYRRL